MNSGALQSNDQRMKELDQARDRYDDSVLAMLPFAADGGPEFDTALRKSDEAFMALVTVITTQFVDQVVAKMPAEVAKLRGR